MIIFRKIRRKDDHLVARLRDRPDCVCDRARSPRRHKQMLRRVLHAVCFIQKCRKSRAHRRNPLRLAVAVQLHRVPALQEFHHLVRECLRHRNRGVSKAEIKHILSADLLRPSCCPLRHLPDHRLCPEHIFIFLCDHVLPPFDRVFLSVSFRFVYSLYHYAGKKAI